jgi:hypothetical protein
MWLSFSKLIVLGHVGSGSFITLNQCIQIHLVPVSGFILTGWFRGHVSDLDQCRPLDSFHYPWTVWFRVHVCGWVSACRFIQFEQVDYNGQVASGGLYVKWISSGYVIQFQQVDYAEKNGPRCMYMNNKFRVVDSFPTSGLYWDTLVQSTCMRIEVFSDHVIEFQQVDYVGAGWFRFIYNSESMQPNSFCPSKWIYIYRLVQGACIWFGSVYTTWFISLFLDRFIQGACIWLNQSMPIDSVPTSGLWWTSWFRWLVCC